MLVRPAIAPELLTCTPQPVPVIATDTDLAYYLLDLANAGEDCRGKLGAVRGLVTP